MPQPVAGQEAPQENVDEKPAKFFERIRASHQFQTCEDEEKLEAKVESQDGSEAKGDPEIVSEIKKLLKMKRMTGTQHGIPNSCPVLDGSPWEKP